MKSAAKRIAIRRCLLAASALLLLGQASTGARAQIKVGIEFGFTGPVEGIAPAMARSAELALKEINDSGLLLDGKTSLVPVRVDSTCVDNAAATAAAERLVTTENVVAIVGTDCSGVAIGVVNNVVVPNGVVMISPSATSPALSDIKSNGYFYRTAPSDARQGQLLAKILRERKIGRVAISYTNNDYGKGFSDAFAAAFKAAGGRVTIAAAHDDGRGDYSAEVGALAAAGGEMLVVLGYADQGGSGIIRAALDSGAFSRFAFGDGLYSPSLIKAFGKSLDGSIGVVPSAEGKGAKKFAALAAASGVDASGAFTGQSYDAAALIALAIQKAKSPDRKAIRDAILSVANGPGELIHAGELAKGLKILKEGGAIDYVGATSVQLTGQGDASGSYREYTIKNGEFQTVAFH